MALHVRRRESAGQLTALTLARYTPAPGRLVMPDVCCDLVWARGRLTLTGPMTHAAETRNAGQEVTLLRLDPLVAHGWLGIPLSLLTDQAVPLADIDARKARAIEDIVDRGLPTELVSSPVGAAAAVDPRVSAAVRQLSRGVRVADTAAAVGLSERQLERLLVDRTGLGPKTFARIVRFRHAMRLGRTGVPLSEAAARVGYADQAHFSRDACALTGHPPRELMSLHGGNVQDVVAGAI